MTAGRRPAPPHFSESFWAILAGIRFVLAAIVFASHLSWFAPVPPALAALVPFGGRAAVLGFLLISGVSVGHSYAERPAGYFRRRFLRIYPLYFVAVFFSQALVFALGSPYALPGITLVAAGWKTGLANLFLLQGFASISITYNLPLWTLSIEVFYYLLAPMLSRLRPQWIAVGITASMALFLFFPKDWLLGYTAARYAWPWLTGFLFACQGRPQLAAGFALIGIAVTAMNKTDTGGTLSWVTFAGSAAAIFCIGKLGLPQRLRGVLNFLGEQSYPLYLFHVPLCLSLFHYAGIRGGWPLAAFTFLLTIVLNYVFDHWLKERFWKPGLGFIVPKMPPKFAVPALADP